MTTLRHRQRCLFEPFFPENLPALYEPWMRQDYAEALKWYRLAAEQGDAASQDNLGKMYASGEGVPQDPSSR